MGLLQGASAKRGAAAPLIVPICMELAGYWMR